ncbi:MAG: hypothetical protein ACIALR_15790, partial [Blastopirellula sp. JB062]
QTPQSLEEALAAELHPEDNGAAELMKIYPGSIAEQMIDSTDAWLPSLPFQFPPLTLEKIHAYVARHQAKLDRGRVALRMPSWKYFWQPTAGYLADVHFVECTRVAARLELLSAAVDLADHDLDGAAEHLAFALEFAARLGQANHVYARRIAAQLREETFAGVAALGASPMVQPDHLNAIRRTLADHIAAWPADADAWIADRACGMHQYELIRDGQFLSTLPHEDYQRMRDEKELEPTVRAVVRNLNADEIFYLQQMQAIIASCQVPFYQRAETLSQLSLQLAALEPTNDYPLVAGNWLLTDVAQQHRIAARDRALAIAWNLAFELAAGGAPPAPPQINPLTGAPFDLQVEPQRISVAAIDVGPNDTPIVLPRWTKP